MSTIAQQHPFQSTSPAYTLFDANAVALATLLGSPVAGASLMALNFQRLGQGAKAITTLLIAIVVTALLILVSISIPGGASAPIAIVLVFATRKIAEVTQGQAVQEQLSRGGRLGSKGVAAALGVGFLIAIGAVIFFASLGGLLPGASESKVTIGLKDEVFYSGSATKQEALALGNRLREIDYLADRGVSVFLDKSPSAKSVSFVVKEGLWNDPTTVSSFEEIGREVGPLVGGFPIQVRLIDKYRNVKVESTVGKVSLSGGDSVYYLGTEKEAEADQFAKLLSTGGFFQGKGVEVFLSRHNNNQVAMSFVVREGLWNDSSMVSAFEKTVRETASTVGGLPVTLRLMNTKLQLEKEVVVR
jgi:hypothetical protein